MVVNRLPIRWRVTAAFAAVLATVVLGIGAFVFWRVSAELDRALDRNLQAQARELAGLVEVVGPNLAPPGGATRDADEQVAQILRADGTVAASSLAGVTLLDPGRLQAALAGSVSWDRPGDGVLDEDLRLLAIPVTRPSGTYVVMVGSSLDERNETLTALLVAEVVGLAVAVLAAGGAGYAIAGLALRPVREALQRERRFVAEASHQLRTPLAIITSEVELAQLAPPDPDGQAATLRSIGEEAQRMARLSDQLLLLAAHDDGRLLGPREPVAVSHLLQAVADRHRGPAADLGRSVRVGVEDGLTVYADRARLEAALDGLVENALRHGVGDIDLAGAAHRDEVVLTVHDQGPGLPAGTEAFDRFRRGTGSSGTGLGLAIVQAVAEAHGGQATIDPDRGGSTVSISLPSTPPG